MMRSASVVAAVAGLASLAAGQEAGPRSLLNLDLPAEASPRGAPSPTVFTYQGRLNFEGNPANGAFDLRFELLDDMGNPVGTTVCFDNVNVTDGLFTVPLDFGPQFPSAGRALRIAARAGGAPNNCGTIGGYTFLTPNVEITASPYALGLKLPMDLSAAAPSQSALKITNSGNLSNTIAVHGVQGTPATFFFTDPSGVRGESSIAVGVFGSTDTGIGVLGVAAQGQAMRSIALGDGATSLFAEADGLDSIAVRGRAFASDSWAGFFEGRSFFSGRVGIGTELPETELHVDGTITLSGNTGGSDWAELKSSGTYIHASGPQDLGQSVFPVLVSSESGRGETGGFYADGDSATIWSPGDGVVGQPDAYLYILDEDAWNSTNTNAYDNNALRAYVSTTGMWIASDARRKQNFSELRSATERLRSLRAYRYEYILNEEEINKGDQPVPVLGFIAQEVAQILPEAVQINDAGEHFMNYDMLIPLLVESVREKDQQISELEARILRLEQLLGGR